MSPDRFIGAWQFVSSEGKSLAGEVSYPFGHGASGYLIYTSDGYMSAQIMHAGRAPFGGAGLRSGTTEQNAEACRTYVAYSGRYEVLADRVIHHVETSLLPDWVGTSQTRYFRFDGDHLVLSTPPMAVEGAEVKIEIVWRPASTKFGA